MDYTERKLPLGLQNFENIRNRGYRYIDKTAYVYMIAHYAQAIFLGRPRRFGKSVFISTLRAYFEGKRHLFKGLAIDGLEKEWKEHPVLYFDFVIGTYTSAASLEHVLHDKLSNCEEKWGGNPEEQDTALRFSKLIKSAYEKAGNTPVVVLVDEYDKPLLEAPSEEIQGEMREKVLKPFYGVLKGLDEYLRLVFFTGVTKFTKVSIFSDLNQIKDISLMERFSGICGITEAEMKAGFSNEIEEMAAIKGMTVANTLAKLRKRYDGYHFSKDLTQGVYNPNSLINTFDEYEFGYFWFETGTPSFLVEMVKKAGIDPRMVAEGQLYTTAERISNYRTDDMFDPIPLMYQTGYLTIKDYDGESGQYLLGFPNEEVEIGLCDYLLKAYIPALTQTCDFAVSRLLNDIKAGNLKSFMRRLTVFFASIPYDLQHKIEKDYQKELYILLKLLGQNVRVEEHFASGRPDFILETADAVYIFEFKLDGKGSPDSAIRQIDGKGYAIPYAASGKRIVKIGAVFDRKKRTIGKWEEA